MVATARVLLLADANVSFETRSPSIAFSDVLSPSPHLPLASHQVSFETPSAKLMHELGLVSTPEQASSSWRTCCYGDGFQYAGDRIVSNFGRLSSEVRPMAEDEPVPEWADFSLTEEQRAGTSGSLTGDNEMHKPVIATFEFAAPSKADSR